MTNKIKPFCVNVQDIDGKGTVATEQQIRDLHKMCVDTGAVSYDSEEEFVRQGVGFPYKGVSKDGDTLSHLEDYLEEWFHNNIIHLSQVPEHLGLESPKEDETLVEGTLEHAYVTLKGDLNKCENGNSDNKFVLFRKALTNRDGYYTSRREAFNRDSLWKTVCTVQEFQTYCEEQRSNKAETAPQTSVNLSEDKSPIESVKPLKWTVCAHKQGIPLQVGMTCVDEEGVELEVKYLGDKLAIVIEVEDGFECSAPVSALLPFPKETSPEEEQREKVVEYLNTISCLNGGTLNSKALSIYEDLSKLGVFKL